MTQIREILRTLEDCFRDRSIDTQSVQGNLKKNRSYRCQWKSDELKIRVEMFQEDSTRMFLNSVLVEKNICRWDDNYLRSAGEAIVKQLTYLQESLRLIELDQTTSALLIRSADPEMPSGEVSYFEIIMKHGAWFGQRNVLALKRFESRRNSNERRSQAAFSLTKPQMERLLEDLIGIL